MKLTLPIRKILAMILVEINHMSERSSSPSDPLVLFLLLYKLVKYVVVGTIKI